MRDPNTTFIPDEAYIGMAYICRQFCFLILNPKLSSILGHRQDRARSILPVGSESLSLEEPRRTASSKQESRAWKYAYVILYLN